MKNDYINNVNSILNDGLIENTPVKNINILKFILFDDNIGNSLYKYFENDIKSSDHNDKILTFIEQCPMMTLKAKLLKNINLCMVRQVIQYK